MNIWKELFTMLKKKVIQIEIFFFYQIMIIELCLLKIEFFIAKLSIINVQAITLIKQVIVNIIEPRIENLKQGIKMNILITFFQIIIKVKIIKIIIQINHVF